MTCDDGLVEAFFTHDRRGISWAKTSHAASAVSVWFDGASPIADAGLLPLIQLAG
ncbi:hypothetical protein [Streptomyces sp. NPDC003006]